MVSIMNIPILSLKPGSLTLDLRFTELNIATLQEAQLTSHGELTPTLVPLVYSEIMQTLAGLISRQDGPWPKGTCSIVLWTR
jgi:hypothetical protein